MQVIEQARITVRGGRGGDGIAAFRREKYVPAGGPSGGDGGHGGPVVLEADSNLQTLLDLKYKRLFAADDGRRGGPNKCTGASGNDLVIKVPCGTEVRHLTTGLRRNSRKAGMVRNGLSSLSSSCWPRWASSDCPMLARAP